jgi:hypothetical protein
MQATMALSIQGAGELKTLDTCYTNYLSSSRAEEYIQRKYLPSSRAYIYVRKIIIEMSCM